MEGITRAAVENGRKQGQSGGRETEAAVPVPVREDRASLVVAVGVDGGIWNAPGRRSQ